MKKMTTTNMTIAVKTIQNIKLMALVNIPRRILPQNW